MVQDAELDCDNPHRFDDLINEQTPGGLNEQVSARPIYGFVMMIISFLIVCSIRVHFLTLYILRFAQLNPFVKALRIYVECLTHTIKPWMQHCLG
jgi:hypothetical protein